MTKPLTNATGYTPEQVQLVKNTVAVGATDDELALFLTVCKNHKLDPFTRQIHFVKRKVKSKDGGYREHGTIQVSIDGFRAIAERSGCYAGNDDPAFDSEQIPRKATVTVWKMVGGVRCPFTASARWEQYFPGETHGFMWKKMPHLMLGKTAEALALRKAFPESLSGLYTDDEMQQADKADAKPDPVEVIDQQQGAPDSAFPSMPTVKTKPAPKPPPTATFVMEAFADAKDQGKLDRLYSSAVTNYKWSPEDMKAIAECYQAVSARLTATAATEVMNAAPSQS